MGVFVGVAFTFNGIWKSEFNRGGVERVGVVFGGDSECFGGVGDSVEFDFVGKSGILATFPGFEIRGNGGGMGGGSKDGEFRAEDKLDVNDRDLSFNDLWGKKDRWEEENLGCYCWRR